MTKSVGSSRRAFAAIALAVAMVMAATTAAAAQKPNQEPPPCFPDGCPATDAVAQNDTSSDDPSQPDGDNTITFAASGSGWSVTCGGHLGSNAVQDPHYSSNAGGAIYKTRLSCKGYGVASVLVRVQGALSFAPASSSSQTSNLNWRLRGFSDQYQRINVDGAHVVTYYTPEPGWNGGRGTGWWRASSTWYFTHNGVRSTTGSQLRHVWKVI